MSWAVSDAEHIRMEFVLIAREPEVGMSETCRQFKVSRKTGYKWLRRYKECGLPGLADCSRRPRSSPLQIGGDAVVELIRLHTRHKTWGWYGQVSARTWCRAWRPSGAFCDGQA
jgi:hypothetical protein